MWLRFQLLIHSDKSHTHTRIAKAGMMRLWALEKSSEDALSLALCLLSIIVFPPSIRQRCLAGTDWAGIHSLLTLLVGAEGKHTARVWLYESTARLAEAAQLNSDDPHSGTIQSN